MDGGEVEEDGGDGGDEGDEGDGEADQDDQDRIIVVVGASRCTS
ncbi:hypothetical protein [Coleofasciculus chthonoplastes]